MAPKAALRPVEIVRNATLVHGGGSKKEYPWIPTIEVIGDKEFISVDRSNREFARRIVCRRVANVFDTKQIATIALQSCSATTCARATR